MHAHKEAWNFFFRSHSDTQLWKLKREKNKKLAKKKRISLLLLLSMLVVGIIFASVYYAATLFFYLKYTLHRLHMVKHGVYINSMVNNKKIKRPSRGAHTTQQQQQHILARRV
jgi:flagellar basal body-associated protein FliL